MIVVTWILEIWFYDFGRRTPIANLLPTDRQITLLTVTGFSTINM